ncbi:MAG TPA: hypothetical protein H9976_02425 [Candidatus Akkermansia intestinavium]|nr:hypothetical protein [Candidatus Akkermansia intestinavium]
MSRHHSTTRYQARISYPTMIWMVAVGLLLGCCGVFYAYLKHEQMLENTEIHKLQQAIAIATLNASQYRAQANALTNRWLMRERLLKAGSELRDIERSQIEVALPLRETERLTINLQP